MRELLHFVFAIGLMFSMTSLHATDTKTLKHELSDSLITTKITSKITENTHLNPLKITVSKDHGVVMLSGNVKSKEAFVEALRLVKTTEGVQSINTENLNIHDVNTSLTDAYITAKVEAAVLEAKVLDDESIPLVGINASTNNGVVTLSGAVKNNDCIAPLLKRILAVHGVERVISHLHVSKTES